MINTYAKYFELVFWCLAFLFLSVTNPSEHHFSLCPLANLGVDWCPGCGLGRSIAAIFHGDFTASIQFHWFGIPAVLIITIRIFELINKLFFNSLNFQPKGEQSHV